MTNPLLESFGEPTKAFVTNSSNPPANLKGKRNPNLPSVCSNYWDPIMALRNSWQTNEFLFKIYGSLLLSIKWVRNCKVSCLDVLILDFELLENFWSQIHDLF